MSTKLYHSEAYEEFERALKRAEFYFELIRAVLGPKLTKLVEILKNVLADERIATIGKDALEIFPLESNDSPSLIEYTQSVILIQMISAFEHYLSRIIEEIFKGMPEAIPVSATAEVALDAFNGLESVREAKDILRALYIEQVARKGIRELLDVIKRLPERLGREAFEAKDLNNIQRAWQIRNLYVHNGGIINEEFKRKCGLKKLKVGRRYVLANKEYLDYWSSIRSVARDLNYLSPKVRENLLRDLLVRQAGL